MAMRGFSAGRRLPAIAALLLFVLFAVFLFAHSHHHRPFTEEGYIYDMIWLDAWVIAFFVLAAIIWLAPASRRARVLSILSGYAIFGFISVHLILAGTAFSYNAFGGDQLFRQAMILKFMTFAVPGDFFHKGLPPFYPPLYYYFLSVYARVFSAEAYQMLKIGSAIIYLVWPFALYWLWRRMVSPMQAAAISLFTFLVCSINSPYPMTVPHAFIADSAFIPWWLHFVVGVNARREIRWSHLVVGSVIGGCLFMTYFYAYFIGVFLLTMRVTLFRRMNFVKAARQFSLRRALAVLVGSAIVSAPLWFPVILSVLFNGMDRSRGGWHHMGVTGATFSYMDFSFLGIIFLISILYVVRRYRAPLARELLLFLGAAFVFLGVGSILGALDSPVNLIKTRQFVLVVAGAFVGLAAVGFLRLGRRRTKLRPVSLVLVAVVIMCFLHGFGGAARSGAVRTARTAGIPNWHLDAKEMQKRQGSVFLSGHPALFAFYPVYSFLFANEHYCHPAVRFRSRYNFLYRLQSVDDPRLFHLALRHNVFDRVDFFMPSRQGNSFTIPFNISNYPDRFTSKTLRYDMSVVNDHTFFVPRTGDYLYELAADRPGSPREPLDLHGRDNKSLLAAAVIRSLLPSLDHYGCAVLRDSLGLDWTGWRNLLEDERERHLADEVDLLDAYAVIRGDSTHLLLALQPKDKLFCDYRFFLHAYPPDKSNFVNYDFPSPSPTDRWEKWNIIWCHTVVPNLETGTRLHLGLFEGPDRLGKGTWLEIGSQTN